MKIAIKREQSPGQAWAMPGVSNLRVAKHIQLTGVLSLFFCISACSQPVVDMNETIINRVRGEVLQKANSFLDETPVTVTDAFCVRSAGGKHDFYSEGDYWWPDPQNPEGPYIQKDGQSNPDNFSAHRHAMVRFSEITATLTSAWLLTGEQKYADKALVHLNAWFVDSATMMNAHMLYAQAISGRFTGRGIGLIDAYHFVEVAQSAKVLSEKNGISAGQSAKIKDWFGRFLEWMTTHKYGIDEMNAQNNHGTCWAATAVSMAVLTGNRDVIDMCADRFKNILLPDQMAADGSFPRELRRTKPYGYSLFNIDAFYNLAQILSTVDNSIWGFTTSDGKSLKLGMEFIFPFIVNKESWPFARDIYIWDEWPVRQSSLLFAGLAYNNREYIDAYLKLEADPVHPEVVRNLPVRHPVIWLSVPQLQWSSGLVFYNDKGKLEYMPDEMGNIIPDFGRVGFGSGEKDIPHVPTVEVLKPVAGDNREHIQQAIDRVSSLPVGADGYRGAIVLGKGIYEVNGSLFIRKSGIVIRGENEETVIRETAPRRIDLFVFQGTGEYKYRESSKIKINEDFVPVGRKFVRLADVSSLQAGDSVLLYRPGTENWVSDLKMDMIEDRGGTRQWKAQEYDLYFERVITGIEGNKVYFDNPMVMQLQDKYGGGYLIKYEFKGRIRNCGIENLVMESAYGDETDNNHGWFAINFTKTDQGWARNVTSKYFGNGCVYIDDYSRNISVLNSQCLDAKSVITGGNRYSFSCSGQLNLFKNCHTTEGRHDYVTGARVCGPNVFTQCTALRTHADIGPHHRWASGTLYDLIDTDGDINVQDRGNWGSGHGWAGVTQVVWNCRPARAAIQSPWVSGTNYCVGSTGVKYDGRLSGRPDGLWEGHNRTGLHPASLYEAQLND